jgi:hypothetical protein
MITPTVTEIRRQLEAVTPDPFLAWPLGPAHPTSRGAEAYGPPPPLAANRGPR